MVCAVKRALVRRRTSIVFIVLIKKRDISMLQCLLLSVEIGFDVHVCNVHVHSRNTWVFLRAVHKNGRLTIAADIRFYSMLCYNLCLCLQMRLCGIANETIESHERCATSHRQIAIAHMDILLRVQILRH